MLGEMSQSDRDRYRAASWTRGTSKMTHRKEIRPVVTGGGAGEGGEGGGRGIEAPAPRTGQSWGRSAQRGGRSQRAV